MPSGAFFLAALLSLTPVGPETAADAAAVGRELLVRINGERAAAGRTPVEAHRALRVVAEERAREIAARGGTGGDREAVRGVSRALRREGYEPHAWLERVVSGTAEPERALGFWEARGGLEQMVEGELCHLGVGVADSAAGPVVVLLMAYPRRAEEWRRAAPLEDLEAVREAVRRATDAARVGRGLAPLVPDEELRAAAQRHAEDMLRRGYYGHRSPEGRGMDDRARAAGYDHSRLAENIARGLFRPEEVVERWLESPGHRANILDPRLREIGVGLAVGEVEGRVEGLWVQLFGRPR